MASNESKKNNVYFYNIFKQLIPIGDKKIWKKIIKNYDDDKMSFLECLQCYRSKFAEIFNELDQKISDIFPENKQENNEKYSLKMELYKMLLECIRLKYSDAKLYLIGSTVSGHGLRDSDMDLCCHIPTPEKFKNTPEKFIEKVYDALKSFLRPSLNDQLLSKAMKELAISVEQEVVGVKKQFDNNIFDECPLVYVIKLTFKGKYKGLKVDLGINNVSGVYSSYLMHHYLAFDDRLRQLCSVIKACSVEGRLLRRTIGSYSIVLLAIHFLQAVLDPPLLPNFIKEFPDLFDAKKKQLSECGVGEERLKLYPNFFDAKKQLNERLTPAQKISAHKLTVGILVVGFYAYYSEFDFVHKAISIRLGHTIPNPLSPIPSMKKEKKTREPKSYKYPVFIEEPFTCKNTLENIKHYRAVPDAESLHECFKRGLDDLFFVKLPQHPSQQNKKLKA